MPVYWWAELKRLNGLTGLKDALINELPQDAQGLPWYPAIKLIYSCSWALPSKVKRLSTYQRAQK